MENLNTEQLKKHIMKELSKVIEVLPGDYYFVKNNAGSQEGTYIFSDKRGYHFVYSERGTETTHKLTDNKFEISFWVVSSVIRTLSMDYMRKNIKPGQNQREMLFKREIELLGEIGRNYQKAGEIYIDEILKVNPL